MKNLLLESIDNESRKAAVSFLKNNFKRCFTLDKQDLPEDEKQKLCQEYVKSVELRYCVPWDAGGCNWTKALIMAITRILKLECNHETSRPTNQRMIERLKKVSFAAMMYRQKQVWDGVPKEQIISKDANGMNFYQLSALVMPMYNELLDIYNNGYGEAWPGKEGQLEVATRRKAEKEAADRRRYEELTAKAEAGEQLTAEEQAFVDRIKAKIEQLNAQAAQAAQQAAAPQAEEQAADDDDEEDADDPWAEDNGFTAEHPRPYMKGRFRIGNTGYWAVRIDTYEQSKTWWWWTYPNCPYPTAIDHTWCITNPNSRNFFYYGIGTSVTAYYVFKEGFEKLTRPNHSASAPYDEWGKSLMCIMINSSFNNRSTEVHVCASRYNQATPENRHANGPGYSNYFYEKKVSKLCELFGCDKQDIYDKFVYKLANQAQQDATAPNEKETTKILNNLNNCNYMDVGTEMICPYNGCEADGARILNKDGYYAVYYQGAIVTPWVKTLSRYTTNKNVYLYYYLDDKLYITNINGKPIFNDALDKNWSFDTYDNDRIMVLKNQNKNTFLVYNLMTKTWATDRPVYGKLKTVIYPYIGLTDGTMYLYSSVKNKLIDITEKVSPLMRNPGDNMYAISGSKNFIKYRDKIYLAKTGEIVNFSNVTTTRPDYIYSSYDNALLTPDGTKLDIARYKQNLANDGYTNLDTYCSTTSDTGKSYIMVYGRKNNNKTVKYCVISTDGTTKELVVECPDGYSMTNNPTARIYTIRTINGDKIIKIDKDNKPVLMGEMSGKYNEVYGNGNHVYFVVKINRHRAKVYNEDCKVVFTVPDNLEMRTRINRVDNTVDGNIIRVATQHGTFLSWTKTGATVPIIGSDIIYIGNNYVFTKYNGEGHIYDDRGKEVMSGKFKLNAGFNNEGIASIISTDEEKKITYFNTDNEYSDSIEELIESVKVKKKTRTDYILEAAAYFC
jgi:hypothetical protein